MVSMTRLPNDDAGPIANMGRAMCAALDQGNAVMCIATGTHRQLLERQLTSHGIDVLAALVREQLVALNARETLSRILIEGVPDVTRFTEVIGALVDRTTVRYPRVSIFGELLAQTRTDGKHAIAIALEDLWHFFAAEHPAVSLHREYPALAFSRRSLESPDRTLGHRTPKNSASVTVEMNPGATANSSDADYLTGDSVA
jgi:hypothetical protein